MTERRDANTSFARVVVDEWVRLGMTHAVIAPGSRSTPLALALAERVRVYVVIDERSAAFLALGIGLTGGSPAALLSTSGTAAVNFHPAVVEADASAIPMVVCTADRPPELRDTGATQTIDQNRLYGSAVRWYNDPGPPSDVADAGRFWRSTACRAWAEATGAHPGPVHLNLPFREPLAPTGAPLVDAPGRADGRPWTEVAPPEPGADPAVVARLVEALDGRERGVLVAGQSPGADAATLVAVAESLGWPVLADAVSGVRVPGTVSTYDALVRHDEWAANHRPDVVVRLGRPLTSKVTERWLAEAPHHVVVAARPSWLDPHRVASSYISGDPGRLLTAASPELRSHPGEWLESWVRSEAISRWALDDYCDGLDEPFEGRVARDVVAAAPDDASMLLGSSMPVRDVESFAAPRAAMDIRSNRGANGIDGMVSTALGMAAGISRPVVALLGDLGFLHDINGLVGAADRGLDVTYVVVDNDGGGIFSFLPQADHRDFELLFGTPHGLDIPKVAEAYGIAVTLPSPLEVGMAVSGAVTDGGIHLIHVRTDRQRNVDLHKGAWDSVAAKLML